MKRGKAWLSQNVETLAARHEERETPAFDVVVVGSGYGGAVAAARLSTLGRDGSTVPLSVAVLERGVEYAAGSFPATFADVIGHQRLSGGAGQTFPEGLMDWRVSGDVWALVANGLGGGSLINAGVCERPYAAIFDQTVWPAPWRANHAKWGHLFARAEHALDAARWPRDAVRKQQIMQDLADRLDGEARSVTVSITPPDAIASVGDEATPPRYPCIECGDCFTGCNVGAKRTLAHTYLARAYRQGVEFYCGATVRRVERLASSASGARWAVVYVFTDPQRTPGADVEFKVLARDVVLAAGTFGTTEILMRSQRGRGGELHFSARLGDGFSGNGDMLSAFYDYGTQVNASAPESTPLTSRKSGPTITTQIEWLEPRGPRGEWRGVVQDLTVPGALGWVFREIVTTMMVPERWTHWNWRCETNRGADPYVVDEEAIQRSLLTVCYVDDGAQGRLEPGPEWGGALRDGALIVRWPELGTVQSFRTAEQRLAAKLPGNTAFLRNPLWQFMPKADYMSLGQTKQRQLTVHPLGGCRLAENADEGVVDAFGRVFDTGTRFYDGAPQAETLRLRHEGRTRQILHDGLHVLDGSVMPCALGINPLLTITALAEGMIDEWQVQYGWHEVRSPLRALPRAPLPQAPESVELHRAPTAVRFREGMAGALAAPLQPDPNNPLHLAMHVNFAPVPDLQAFVQASHRETALTATFHLGARRTPMRTGREVVQPIAGNVPLTLAGAVQWFAREPSNMLCRLRHSGWAYLRNRFAADFVESSHQHEPLFGGLWDKLKGLTHFGAVRQLAYRFEPLPHAWALPNLTLPAGTVITGTKRVGYRIFTRGDPDSTNPWRQLSEMPLVATTPDGVRIELGVLEFVPLTSLDRYQLPLEVLRQHNALTAFQDLMSLGLYFARALGGLHMLNFRRPEYPVEINGPRALLRLPPLTYDARDPRFRNLTVSAHAVDVPLANEPNLKLRLTRVRPAQVTQASPVVLFHGLGSGGIQFTHPGIEAPMATWLAQQGFDVWVPELRTSIGLETSRRQWLMDDIAREDVPALIAEVCRLANIRKVSVIAHCIGSAMFCMSMLSGRLAGRVDKAILMQVGPRVELPQASKARGYLAFRVQQLLGADTVDSVASQDVTDTEVILDRLLGSLVYPAHQRPHYRLGCDLRKNTRRTNANRSAGIFGQLFEYENMSPRLLDHLDDLLGHVNLTTYEQTAQFVFYRRLVDQAGDDVYVTPANVAQYFNIPVLLIHGEENQTFDPMTLERNQRLFQRAGVPVEVLSVPGHGHLDCVVGTRIAEMIYPAMLRHLLTPPVSHPTEPSEPRTALPAIGPWIGHAARNATSGDIELHIGVRVDDYDKPLAGVVSLMHAGTTPLADLQVASPHAAHEYAFNVTIDPASLASHTSVEVTVMPVYRALPASANEFIATSHGVRQYEREQRSLAGLPDARTPSLRLDAEWIARQINPSPQDLGLILGACRQRPLLVDRELADRGMSRIVAALDGNRESALGAHVLIDAVVLSGDQVYADSRAMNINANATRGRFNDAYREAWTAPHQHEVMRRRPVYMALDDHEFSNDYNDVVARERAIEFMHARDAWQKYLIAAGPPREPLAPSAAWTATSVRGFGVFLCDTRSARRDQASLSRHGAAIMGPLQMYKLKQWLLQREQDASYGARAKIVVMGTPVVPFFASANTPSGALGSDGWQRFPDSLAELFEWIAIHGIRNVVFLSGDYHHFADVNLTLEAPGRPRIGARCIVTSGLYTPYPFANAEVEEWLTPAACAPLRLRAGHVKWGYQITRERGGSGYTRLSFHANGRVDADFVVV